MQTSNLLSFKDLPSQVQTKPDWQLAHIVDFSRLVKNNYPTHDIGMQKKRKFNRNPQLHILLNIQPPLCSDALLLKLKIPWCRCFMIYCNGETDRQTDIQSVRQKE
jgi:hypothetical protein